MFRAAPILFFAMTLAACGGDGSSSENDARASRPAEAAMTSMERGAILYKRCRSCHTLGQGERNRVGPNLWGIFGQTAGARPDFNYSSAMAASDIVWADDTLSAYLENPRTYIPGNRMSFIGLKKEDDRLAVIEYLRANTDG